jgi:hypothetical protein
MFPSEQDQCPHAPSFHGVNADVCPDIIVGITVDVKTGETAVVLFRA